MDFQNRVGSKTGGGGVSGWSESNRDRKERLRKLALETIDLNKVGTLINAHHTHFMTFLAVFSAGSLLYEEPSGYVRMQALSHAAQYRGELFSDNRTTDFHTNQAIYVDHDDRKDLMITA